MSVMHESFMKDSVRDGDRLETLKPGMPEFILQVSNLKAWYGKTLALRDVNMSIRSCAITALIGPSGCGKSTYIRCFNRMHEVSSGGRVEGEVLMNGQNIYAKDVDPVTVRRRIGMVFQKASVFPTMSIFDNLNATVEPAQ
jgi:phosphate transport system ATP-binding protein